MTALTVDIAHRAGEFALRATFATHATGVTALFGPSGAGKSTLLDAIAGLLRPDSGRIEIDGDVLFDGATGTFVPPERRRVGCVFQRPLLFPHMRVRDNCLFGARRRDALPDDASFGRVVAMLDIERLLDRYPRHLSGGERQRVAMARALFSRPRMLLLDEPLAAVDEARRREILPYLERLRDEAGVPILYVSHSVAEVTRLADTVAVIEGGEVVANGAVDVVFSTGAAHLGDDEGVVIAATVARHDDTEALTHARFAGGELILPRVQAAPGAQLKLFVHARDVMLSRAPLEAVSANNVLPGEVLSVEEVSAARLDVRVRCGETDLVARITRTSAVRLELMPAQRVYAVIKTLQLRRG